MSCAIPFSSCFPSKKAFFALEEASFANNPIFAQMILPQNQIKRLLGVPLSAQIDQFTAFGRRKLVFFGVPNLHVISVLQFSFFVLLLAFRVFFVLVPPVLFVAPRYLKRLNEEEFQ